VQIFGQPDRCGQHENVCHAGLLQGPFANNDGKKIGSDREGPGPSAAEGARELSGHWTERMKGVVAVARKEKGAELTPRLFSKIGGLFSDGDA